MPNAITTNAITNGLHAFALFIYFTGALFHFLKKDAHFPLLVVLAFFVLFILKILGVYVHYSTSHLDIPFAWIAISLLAVLLNYVVIQALDMPDTARVICLFLSLLFSYLFIINTEEGNFLYAYIALSIMLVYLIAAYYSTSLLRVGFLMTVISNVAWMLARQIENHLLGHEISPFYRYDNDVYHLLLIISTFIIYKATLQTGWKNKKST